MAKTILIAGYTKLAFIRKIPSYFPGEEVNVLCAYTRQPVTPSKQKNLDLFDATYDLSTQHGQEQLAAIADTIDCVTCTQERDMAVYIQALHLCNKITKEQVTQYSTIIDKHSFKTILSKEFPELVPDVHIINEALLERLEELSYPLVIKPSGLAGSIMVHVVHTPAEFREHYEACAQTMHSIANEHYLKEISIIAESYITGPQYSANVYIAPTGTITLCPLVRVVTPQEFGISDTYSVLQYPTTEVSDALQDSLTKAIQNVVSTFGLKATSAHFDCVLHEGQWKFFEVGLRIGGNRQKLFETSHGFDHFGNDIQNRLGKKITIPESRKQICVMQTAAITSGTLTSISYTRTIATASLGLISEDKIAKIGMPVKPVSLGGGTITRHYITGKEIAAVLETSKKLFVSIQFDIK